MNPVDEFLTYEFGIQKEAMSPVKGALLTGLVSAGTIAAGTIATGAAQDVLDIARSAVSRTLDYRRMIKDNPEIKKLDRGKTQAYFNTLHRFSPEMAGDPTVAASWVKRMGEFDYVDPATVQQLVSTSERMRTAKNQQRIPPYMLAQAATMAGMERMKELRTDLTPAQKALVEAQRGANIEAQQEHAMRMDQAQQMAEHQGEMDLWRAQLPSSQRDFIGPIPPPPSPAFKVKAP